LAISTTSRRFQAFSFRQALSDQGELLLRRGNTLGKLLLEGVQHVDSRGELRRVHRVTHFGSDLFREVL
jgi:hypothetical protein